MNHCKTCNGPCSNRPAFTPQIFSQDLRIDQLYKHNEWVIDLTRGMKGHKHGRKYYRVFNHYWNIEQGYPNREPILICTYCHKEIPKKEYMILQAARKLLKNFSK